MKITLEPSFPEKNLNRNARHPIVFIDTCMDCDSLEEVSLALKCALNAYGFCIDELEVE